ncbi:MAG: SDR family NAD(P)-dependent oxidoreductase [Acidobacteriota bacterium]|nr:SDR family NAD(P)-dependent oxidoreductase [Acidobacteriota bacterium]
MERLKGRTAVVTGASRGIGAAVAERLAAEGAAVAVVARTVDHHAHLEGSLNLTVEKCRAYGSDVFALAADLSDEESRAAIVPAALERFDGRLDILVNNAAAAVYQPLMSYPLKRRRITFEVNVHAPADLIQAAVPAMIDRGEGWIVNLSSATARYGEGVAISDQPLREGMPRPSDMGVYGASKAALNRLTVAFAQSLAGTGVRVNTVAPRSGVATEGTLALIGDSLGPDRTESMEAMVEGTLALCDCGPERSGGIHYSLDLLEELGATVMTLDGSRPYPGGFRVSSAD